MQNGVNSDQFAPSGAGWSGFVLYDQVYLPKHLEWILFLLYSKHLKISNIFLILY